MVLKCTVRAANSIGIEAKYPLFRGIFETTDRSGSLFFFDNRQIPWCERQ